MEAVIIDAKDTILGRLGAKVAKMLLLGKGVALINAEQASISGSLQAAKEKYLKRLTQKHKADPSRSPKWPRVPRMLVKRIIRGMLPYKTQRGRHACKRLMVYEGVPRELDGKGAQRFAEFDAGKIAKRFSVLSLCRELGYRG